MAKQVTVALSPGSIDAEATLVRIYRGTVSGSHAEIGTLLPGASPLQYVDRGPGGTGLPDGRYYYVARQEDAVANLSEPGNEPSVLIDTTAPGTPQILTLTVGDFAP